MVDTHFMPTLTFSSIKSLHTHSNEFTRIKLEPNIGHKHSLPTNTKPVTWCPSSPKIHFISNSPTSIHPWINIHLQHLQTMGHYLETNICTYTSCMFMTIVVFFCDTKYGQVHIVGQYQSRSMSCIYKQSNRWVKNKLRLSLGKMTLLGM